MYEDAVGGCCTWSAACRWWFWEAYLAWLVLQSYMYKACSYTPSSADTKHAATHS